VGVGQEDKAARGPARQREEVSADVLQREQRPGGFAAARVDDRGGPRRWCQDDELVAVRGREDIFF
jgi:hypothetical protein